MEGREWVKKRKKKIGLAAPAANATNPNEITAGRVMGLHSLRWSSSSKSSSSPSDGFIRSFNYASKYFYFCAREAQRINIISKRVPGNRYDVDIFYSEITASNTVNVTMLLFRSKARSNHQRRILLHSRYIDPILWWWPTVSCGSLFFFSVQSQRQILKTNLFFFFLFCFFKKKKFPRLFIIVTTITADNRSVMMVAAASVCVKQPVENKISGIVFLCPLIFSCLLMFVKELLSSRGKWVNHCIARCIQVSWHHKQIVEQMSNE